MSSGQFTILRNDPTTGRAHLCVVRCDLCSVDAEFNPRDYLFVEDGIREAIGKHICKKPGPPKPETVAREVEEPAWGMIGELGRRLVDRLGRK